MGRWMLGLLAPHEPIAPVRPLVLRRGRAARARVAWGEGRGAGGVPPRQPRSRRREPRPKRPCEPSGRPREDRLHRPPLFLPAALRVGDGGAGASAGTRSCWPRIAPRRWAAARWSSASPAATQTSRPATRRAATPAPGPRWRDSCGSASTTCASCEPRYDETPLPAPARAGAGAAPGRAAGRFAAGRPGRRASRPGGAARAPLNAGCPIPAAMRQFLIEQQPDVAADHAAHRHRLAAAGSLRGRARPRHPHACCRSAAGTTCPARRCCASLPDRVLVWNPMQRQEAVELHGLPADRVVVTGAQCYDQWFGRQPSRSREDFCARVGLDPEPAVRALHLLVALPRHGQRAGVRASHGCARCAPAPTRG